MNEFLLSNIFLHGEYLHCWDITPCDIQWILSEMILSAKTTICGHTSVFAGIILSTHCGLFMGFILFFFPCIWTTSWLHLTSLWFPTICVFGVPGWWLQGILHCMLIDLEHTSYIAGTTRCADRMLNFTQTITYPIAPILGCKISTKSIKQFHISEPLVGSTWTSVSLPSICVSGLSRVMFYLINDWE